MRLPGSRGKLFSGKVKSGDSQGMRIPSKARILRKIKKE